VKFWDASAIVPLLVAEASSPRLQSLAAKEGTMLVWWGSEVECVSALARRERDGALDVRAMEMALRRLRQIADAWHEIDPSDAIRETANRFLRVHPLRAADALQVAAAFAAAERRPASLEIVTLDDRLADAARKEGFVVVDLTDDRRDG
jgi:predicted nucleic acid-binding protein